MENGKRIYKLRLDGEIYTALSEKADAAQLCTATYLQQLIYRELKDKQARKKRTRLIHPFVEDYTPTRGRRKEVKARQITMRLAANVEAMLVDATIAEMKCDGISREDYENDEFGQNEYAAAEEKYRRAIITSCILWAMKNPKQGKANTTKKNK